MITDWNLLEKIRIAEIVQLFQPNQVGTGTMENTAIGRSTKLVRTKQLWKRATHKDN